MIRCLASIAALSLLAACSGDEPLPEGDDARTASGEVLEGTISDAMLPVETLRSQPPLAEPSPGAASAIAGAGEDGEETGEGEAAKEDGEAPGNGETGAVPAEPAAETPEE